MTLLDFFTYCKPALITFLILSGFGGVTLLAVFTFIQTEHYSNKYEKLKDMAFLKLWSKITYLIICAVSICILVPTHDSIVELKISKFKNEMLTVENINGSLARIDSIAKKLECKYLGCEENKKESK